MPAKDKYHDSVKRALEKADWIVVAEQVTLIIEGRYVFVDMQAQKSESDIILVEVKRFDDVSSKVTQLENAIGQYILYRSVISYLGLNQTLYLSVSQDAYETIFSERLSKVVVEYNKINLLVCDIKQEVITQWITW